MYERPQCGPPECLRNPPISRPSAAAWGCLSHGRQIGNRRDPGAARSAAQQEEEQLCGNRIGLVSEDMEAIITSAIVADFRGRGATVFRKKTPANTTLPIHTSYPPFFLKVQSRMLEGLFLGPQITVLAENLTIPAPKRPHFKYRRNT